MFFARGDAGIGQQLGGVQHGRLIELAEGVTLDEVAARTEAAYTVIEGVTTAA